MNGFLAVDHAEPHRARALDILRRHPEVRALFGRNPATALLIVGSVGAQLALAFLLRDAPWWAALVLAWTVGAVLTHLGLCLFHECAHEMVFRSKLWNNVFGILANLPHVIPSYASFRRYHLKHHQYQGDYERDADLASHWEARLVGTSFRGKVVWQLLFPFFQTFRVIRFMQNGNISFLTGWVAVNLLAVLGMDAYILWAWGGLSFFYVTASFFFSVGFHPLGARWIQEHFLVGDAAETNSYYGPFNRVAANIGYHNEHHDFPFIPWNRLPALKALAPEVYDALPAHRSWTRLWITFLTDRRLSLYSRIARGEQVNGTRRPLPPGLYAPATFDETAEGAA
jgi:sphingolipid 4-desaturase/C4-monooxygenase